MEPTFQSSSRPAAPVLSVSGVGKTYAEPVLADVTLALVPGEALALTGENGAGKSTLSKIIGGLVEPSAGTMRLAGEPYAPASRTHAEALGVRMVMQELNLLPTLSVAENLFLNRLPRRFGVIDRARLRDDARVAMAQVGLDAIDPDTPVGALGIGHQQMVEIARNLIGDCRVLILDEPTAMLTAREVELLFEQIDRLKARGVAIVYISHRLEELARVAERVAVLRDGRLVHVGEMAATTSDALVTLMVGREIGEHIDLGERHIGAPRLVVSGLTRAPAVRDVSLEVRAGEIFGISGLIGAGRTELLRLIYGADTPDAGTIAVGQPPRPVAIRSPVDAVKLGIALITEDRKGEGLLLSQSVTANVSLGQLDRLARAGVVDTARETALAERQIEALRIRAHGAAQPVGELSGGNQQKVVIGRWLARDMGVLLFDEPTRGIDVG
ncbi:sugar ABC transporter ATP-binding protein, partial [Burkholderia multivorans]